MRNARNLDNKDTFVCTFSLVVFSVSPQFPEWDNSPFRSILSSLLKIEADVRRYEVEDFPAIVCIDAEGNDFYKVGIAKYSKE